MTHPQPAPGATPRRPRIHGLDAVRGAALLLGIVLHSLMPFAAGMPWLVEDSQREGWQLPVISGIHLFRMTLFLIMAGYFGRMMRDRRGTRGYLADRAKRIALPLFVFWPVAVLPLGLLAAWHAGRIGVEVARPDIGGHGGVLGAFDLGHLWFLWVLTQVILLALVLRWVVTRWMPGAGAAPAARVTRWLTSPGGVLLAAVPYAITTNLQREASGIIAPSTLMPEPTALIAYLGAFVVGWLFSRDPDALPRLGRQAWGHLAAAVTATGAALLTTRALPLRLDVPQPVWSTLLAVAGWTTCYALVGLAVRYLTVERAWVRYLADASYWMYLMHLVLLTFFEVLLAGLTWPPAVKALLNISVTTVILLVTYHLVVRSTPLGGWLNGHRAARRTSRERRTTSPADREADALT